MWSMAVAPHRVGRRWLWQCHWQIVLLHSHESPELFGRCLPRPTSRERFGPGLCPFACPTGRPDGTKSLALGCRFEASSPPDPSVHRRRCGVAVGSVLRIPDGVSAFGDRSSPVPLQSLEGLCRRRSIGPLGTVFPRCALHARLGQRLCRHRWLRPGRPAPRPPPST